MTDALNRSIDEDVDLWSDERTPAWRVLLPLLVVIGSLVALLVLPPLITERNAALRQQLVETYAPLSQLVGSIERATSAELGAARGYALTGDPFFVDRFLSVHSHGNQLSADLDSLAARVGGDAAQTASALVATRERWSEANFGHTRASFREGLPVHQQHYDAVIEAAMEFREALAASLETHNRRIEDVEQLRNHLTIFLAVLALMGAGGVLWLGQRLRHSGHHILRRAREEAALRQIAQTMTQSDDLSAALERIAMAVAGMVDADRVRIEQIDADQDQVEVIAAIGDAAEPVGSREAFQGSASEQALSVGRPVWLQAGEQGEVEMDESQLPVPAEHSLIVPLLSEGEPLGSLILMREPSRRPFDAPEGRRTALLADMAALVLRRLQLFDEIRQKEAALQASTDELRLLNETLEERVRDRTRTVRSLARQLSMAEHRERKEIAQVLHDDLQQVLFALILNISALEAQIASLTDENVRQELARAHEIATEAMAATRRLTVDLSPPIKADETLIDALEWLAAHVRERFGLQVNLKANIAVSVSDEEMRLLLFRIVRELLFNVVKHAGTDTAEIAVAEDAGELVLEVSDQGRGFEQVGSPAERESTIGGFGLTQVHERLSLFGGRIDIESRPGQGTRASVRVPLNKASGR